ncbi:MAG: hypothetical protein JSR77_06645 [Planctomycetes bacterium]|nr:hypothetical protein [Planctomycetota bacterium]
MKHLNFSAAIAALLAAASASHAIIVQGTELSPYIAVTNQLAMSHGAKFSSLNNPFVTFTELIPGTWGIQGTEPWANPIGGYSWYSSPIFVDFVDPADGTTPAVVNGTISAMWGDGGGDLDGVDMRAYDLSNNLVTSGTFTGVTFTQIQVTGVGIHRIEFWANTMVGGPNSDTGLDWLSYPTPSIPAPGAVAALAVVAVSRLRRPRR